MNNEKATTNEEKAKLFRQFLELIFIAEPEHKISGQKKMLIEMNILNDNDLETIDINENHKNIEKEELKNILKKLDVKKARGEDKITNKMIKLTFNGIKEFVLKLFNSSLYRGYYPKVFKKIPGKPKSEIKSYRQSSLTSCLGKILEKTITNRVKDWCNKNNIINQQQNGFRSKISTNDNQFKLTQSLKQNTIKRFVTSAVFLDVEKAFNQVWHADLLHKINFGIDQNLLRWINSFLCERSISIKIEGIKSDIFTPKHGVPQSSPLSPIFVHYLCKQYSPT